jgi:hypothetical protein
MKTRPTISIGFCKPTFPESIRVAPELSFYAALLQQHYDLRFEDVPDFLFYGEQRTGEHLLYPSRTIRIFTMGENIPPDWDVADYALTHERIYSERHWRLPVHRHYYSTPWDRPKPVRDFAVVRQRVVRFCNFIYSNENAKERVAFFDLLSQYKRVDAGGGVRNNLGFKVANKREFVSGCKFTIAFENSSRAGYATEKVIEPLLVGSIPIYWGDPTIELDFNPDCLINVHRFKNFEAVMDEVIRIDQNDRLWEQYVTAPIFRNNQIPYELSDEAFRRFFEHVFTKRRRYVGRIRKTQQRIQVRAFAAVRRAGQIGRGATRRLRSVVKRILGERLTQGIRARIKRRSR